MQNERPTPGRDALYRWDRVHAITGLSRSTISTKEREGTFPRRITVTPRTVAWLASAVHAWVDEQAAAARAPIAPVAIASDSRPRKVRDTEPAPA